MTASGYDAILEKDEKSLVKLLQSDGMSLEVEVCADPISGSSVRAVMCRDLGDPLIDPLPCRTGDFRTAIFEVAFTFQLPLSQFYISIGKALSMDLRRIHTIRE